MPILNSPKGQSILAHILLEGGHSFSLMFMVEAPGVAPGSKYLSTIIMFAIYVLSIKFFESTLPLAPLMDPSFNIDMTLYFSK